MHCHICDREEDLVYNKVTGEFEPCSHCQEVIDDCLADFDQAEDEDPVPF